MRRVRENRRAMDAFAHLSAMRRDFVLRQLAESARQQTRARGGTSGDRLSATGRTLVVLLPGRRFQRILTTAARQKFFAHNFAVLNGVNADLGHFSPLL